MRHTKLTISNAIVYITVVITSGTKYPTLIGFEKIFQKIKYANATKPIISKVNAEAKFCNVLIFSTAKNT